MNLMDHNDTSRDVFAADGSQSLADGIAGSLPGGRFANLDEDDLDALADEPDIRPVGTPCGAHPCGCGATAAALALLALAAIGAWVVIKRIVEG